MPAGQPGAFSRGQQGRSAFFQTSPGMVCAGPEGQTARSVCFSSGEGAQIQPAAGALPGEWKPICRASEMPGASIRACSLFFRVFRRIFLGAGFSDVSSSPRSPPAELSGRRNFGPALPLSNFPGGRFSGRDFQARFLLPGPLRQNFPGGGILGLPFVSPVFPAAVF